MKRRDTPAGVVIRYEHVGDLDMPHPNITAVLVDLQQRATARGHKLPDVRVMEGRASEFREARAHAYCTKGPWGILRIVYAPKLVTSNVHRIRGVLGHEYGHAVLMTEGLDRHSERDADKVAEDLFGFDVSYDADLVQTTRRGTRPRPAHLG